MFEYTSSIIPYKFFVFGCGGTGSRLVPLLAQFVKSCEWLKPFSPEIILIDPDIVEEKNLFRQNFIKKDIHKGKSVVLAERYSKGFDIPVKAFFGKIDREQSFEVTNDFRELSQHSLEDDNVGGPIFNNGIIFLCVDSIQARKDIINYVKINSGPNLLIIDTGNENDFGQVKLMGAYSPYLKPTERAKYNNSIGALPIQVPVKHAINQLPFDDDYFESMTAPTETRSCADLDQTMAINCMVANTAFSVLQNILYRKPIGVHRYNISLQHGTHAEYFTWKYIDNLKRNTTEATDFTRMNIFEPIEAIHKEMAEKFPLLLKGDSQDTAPKKKELSPEI